MRSKKLLIAFICLGLILGQAIFCSAKGKTNKTTINKVSKTVIWVQKSLKHLGYYQGKITGSLGKTTREAVKAFQKDHGLKVDGIPGRHTRKGIRKAIKGKLMTKRPSSKKAAK